MTNIEAYNSMIDGFAVSHKLFSPEEFLYMDESHIIRDENGEEYETTWDVKSQMDQFKTDWFICKNRTDINKKIAMNKYVLKGGPDAIEYIEDQKYQEAIASEPVDNKFIRSIPVFDENGNQSAFTIQDGLFIESAVNCLTCRYMNNCKIYQKEGPDICRTCNVKTKKVLATIDIILEILIILALFIYVWTPPLQAMHAVVIASRILAGIAFVNWGPAFYLYRRFY